MSRWRDHRRGDGDAPRVSHAAPPSEPDGIRARIEGRPASAHGPMPPSWFATTTACGNVEIHRTDFHIPTTHPLATELTSDGHFIEDTGTRRRTRQPHGGRSSIQRTRTSDLPRRALRGVRTGEIAPANDRMIERRSLARFHRSQPGRRPGGRSVNARPFVSVPLCSTEGPEVTGQALPRRHGGTETKGAR